MLNAENQTEVDLARFLQADEYALHHLARHLHKAGEQEKLYRLLIGNKAWMEAKVARLGGPTDYIAELILAIGDFADPVSPSQLEILTQLYAARHTAASEEAILTDAELATLVFLGCYEQAKSNADLRQNVRARSQGLLTIYSALRDLGLAGQHCLQDASKAAHLISNRVDRIYELCELAEAFAVAGSNAAADALFNEAAEAVEDPDSPWTHEVVVLQTTVVTTTLESGEPILCNISLEKPLVGVTMIKTSERSGAIPSQMQLYPFCHLTAQIIASG